MTWRIIFSLALMPVTFIILIWFYDLLPDLPTQYLDESELATALTGLPTLIMFTLLVIIPTMRSSRG